MAAAVYSKAPDVELVAKQLIQTAHPELVNTRIEYAKVDKTPKRGAKEIWGQCRKVSGVNAFLAENNPTGETFFLIVISAPVWDSLPTDKREALVDHELCHASQELNLVKHDLEEFTGVVKRHGLWRDDVRSFAEEAKKQP